MDDATTIDPEVAIDRILKLLSEFGYAPDKIRFDGTFLPNGLPSIHLSWYGPSMPPPSCVTWTAYDLAYEGKGPCWPCMVGQSDSATECMMGRCQNPSGPAIPPVIFVGQDAIGNAILRPR